MRIQNALNRTLITVSRSRDSVVVRRVRDYLESSEPGITIRRIRQQQQDETGFVVKARVGFGIPHYVYFHVDAATAQVTEVGRTAYLPRRCIYCHHSHTVPTIRCCVRHGNIAA